MHVLSLLNHLMFRWSGVKSSFPFNTCLFFHYNQEATTDNLKCSKMRFWEDIERIKKKKPPPLGAVLPLWEMWTPPYHILVHIFVFLKDVTEEIKEAISCNRNLYLLPSLPENFSLLIILKIFVWEFCKFASMTIRGLGLSFHNFRNKFWRSPALQAISTCSQHTVCKDFYTCSVTCKSTYTLVKKSHIARTVIWFK